MKLKLQRILFCALAVILSITACVFGMYMAILAHMVIGYRILFCAVFMLNPIAVIFAIRYMIKKAVPKEEATEGGEEPHKKKRRPFFGKKDEEPVTEASEPFPEPETETEMVPAETSYDGNTYSETYGGTAGSGASYSEPMSSEPLFSDSSYSGSAFADSSYTEPSYSDTSFSGSAYDDIPKEDSFGEPTIDRTAGPVTEESVKKISLKRKKRPADE